ncbi:hypothetical protein D3C81_1566610 [compost metagenome]
MTRAIANEAQIDRIVRTIIMHEVRERDFYQNHGRVMDTLKLNLESFNPSVASAIITKQLQEL